MCVSACVCMPAFLIHLFIYSILGKKYFRQEVFLTPFSHKLFQKMTGKTGISPIHDSGMLFCPFAKHQCVCAPRAAKLKLLSWIRRQLGLMLVAGPTYTIALVPIENEGTGAHYKGVLYHHQMFHIIPWQNNASVFIMKTNWFGPVSILFVINAVFVIGGTLPTLPVLLAPTKPLKADFHRLSVVRQWGLCKCGLIWAAVCFFCRGNLSLKNWEDEWVVPWAVFLLIWPSFTLDTMKESALADGAHNSLVLMKTAWQLHKSLLDTTNRLLHTNL